MDQLEILRRILTLAPAYTNVDAEQERVFDEIVALCKPDIACFYDFDAADGRLVARAVYPQERWRNDEMQEFWQRELAQGAIGMAIQEQRAVLIEDPEADQARGRYIPFCDDVGTEIVVPIFASQTLHGVLVLSRFRERAFNNRDLLHVEIAAEGLALGYQTREARGARERTVQFLAGMSELDPSDIDGALTTGLRRVREFLDGRFSTLWLYNELDGTLVVRAFEPSVTNNASVTFDSFAEKVVSFEGSAFEKGANERVYSESLLHYPEGRDPDWDVVSRLGCAGRITFPITRRDQGLYGLLNVYHRSPTNDPTTAEHLKTVALLTSRLVDVSSLWLFSQRNSIVARCDKVLHDMDREESQNLWDELANLIAEQMRCEACSIFMEHHGDLVLKGSTGIIDEPPYRSVRYKPGKGLTGDVYVSGSPVIYYEENAAHFKDKHISAFREKLKTSQVSRSLLVVPVRDALDRTVGVIRCNNKDTSPTEHCGRFTREDVEHLTLIGEVAYHTVFRGAWLMERDRQQQSYLDRLHHEILGPLDGVLGHIDWLSKVSSGQIRAVEDQADLIRKRSDDVVAAVRLISFIVKSIGYEEKDEWIGSLAPIKVAAMLNTCRGWLLTTARPKNVDVKIDYIGSRSKILGDEKKMLRVFFNLMVNAIKYSDRHETTRYVRVYGVERMRAMDIYFEDNGIGIPEEDAAAIFDRYYRAENAQRVYPEGSGLGLSYSRYIVEAHHGKLDVVKLRKPTIFRIVLPTKNRGGD